MIQNIRKFPKNPGVYFFSNKNRRVLYLGKAANLKNRLKSYFDKSPKNPRLQKMLETAKDVDWQETGSEVEALILESQLIKKYRPPFNIMLRDDKQYFYVVFTKEVFPKVFVTHQPKAKNREPRAVIAGPFTDGTALRATLKLLRRIFPYCTCKQKHNNYCLNYHIGNCPGFCCLKESKIKNREEKIKEYRKNIKAVKEVLEGKRVSLIKRFKKEMNALAQKDYFEKAIELRDKIEKLKRVFENARVLQKASPIDISTYQYGEKKLPILERMKKLLNLPVAPKRVEGYDVSNIQGKFATGAMVVFTDGRPDKNEYRKFRIQTAGGLPRRLVKAGDTEMLREILTRRFRHPEWPRPDLILIDGGKAQLNAARSAILGHRKSRGLAMSKNSIPIITLAKDAKHKGSHIYTSNKKTAVPLRGLPPAVRNLILQIDAEAHRFAIRYYRKLHKIKTGFLSHDSNPVERLG